MQPQTLKPTNQRFDCPLEIKTVSESGEFSGYGSVFGVKDSHSDIVVKGAFERSLHEHKERGQLPALLWQHKTDEPLGVYSKMSEDDHGLYVEGTLLIKEDPAAARAHAHLKAGSVRGLSIGYNLDEDGYEYDAEKEAFILKSIDLWEVSLVTFPSNREATVDNVKSIFESGKAPDERLIERVLRESGFSRSKALAFIARGYKGLTDEREASDPDALSHLRNTFNL